jgi:hypothetical protein
MKFVEMTGSAAALAVIMALRICSGCNKNIKTPDRHLVARPNSPPKTVSV